MYLIDTNIWIELFLNQEKSDEVLKFFDMIESKNIFISEFTFYSIGILLFKLKKYDLFERYLSEFKRQ